MNLNNEVRAFWEREPCGTGKHITGELEKRTLAWFEHVEEHRYRVEPYIHTVAEFQRHHGKKMLEVGVGAGTDHLQWARAGLDCHGVDLTDAAIDTTRTRLEMYGFRSDLRRIDAEVLPFPEATFDLVYSWGVIHHSETPERIVAEIHRVLKPGGKFIGMLYARKSMGVFNVWIKQSLMKGKPWQGWDYVNWHYMESVGTKGYNKPELARMFDAFGSVQLKQWMTEHDRHKWPRWLSHLFPAAWGRFITVRAKK